MSEIWTMGEILVEIMRPKIGIELSEKGEFVGPFPSGAPAIFIDTVAKLGHKAGIIGGIGDDDFGKNVLDRLLKDGVNCDYVRKYAGMSTAVAFVTYFSDGSRKFIFHIDGTPAVLNRINKIDMINNVKYFHIMGCSLMANDTFRESIFTVMEEFIKKGAKITFDPNIRVELLRKKNIDKIMGKILENCSILFPGIEELKFISGRKNIEEAVKQLFKIKTMEIIILKRGKKGCTVFTRNESFDINSFQINEIDPTGAGDCFDAGFLCGLIEGKSIIESCKIASACGALNASSFGPMEGEINQKTVYELIEMNKYGL